MPFSMLTQERRRARRREKEEEEEAIAARRRSSSNNETRPMALGTQPPEVEADPSAPISIPAEQVTMSVGTATNVTFDLHLLEDFKHLFDDVSLGSLDNNTNLVILKIAAPVVVALALEPLISLVDTYYVGHYLGACVRASKGAGCAMI